MSGCTFCTGNETIAIGNTRLNIKDGNLTLTMPVEAVTGFYKNGDAVKGFKEIEATANYAFDICPYCGRTFSSIKQKIS